MTQLAKMKVPSLVEETLSEAFPDIDPGVVPFGSGVVIQIKSSAVKTKGGIVLLKDAVQTENDTTQVAKVIRLGPVAFCNRETGKQWPEGAWAAPGDFVRVPLHLQQASSWSVAVPGKDFRVTFSMVEDLALKGSQPDPFYPRAYL